MWGTCRAWRKWDTTGSLLNQSDGNGNVDGKGTTEREVLEVLSTVEKGKRDVLYRGREEHFQGWGGGGVVLNGVLLKGIP